MEPVAVAAALTALNHVSSLARNLVATVKDSGKAEIIGQFIDLQSAMLDLQQKQQDLIARMREVEDENRRLKAAAELGGKMSYVGKIYVLKGLDNRDGEYCQVCFDLNGKLVRVFRVDSAYGHGWRCDACDRFFDD